MHVIQVAQTGGPEVLKWKETATPEPGEGEMLVAMAAAGLNYVETYHRRGMYAKDLPFVLGGEGAGTVTALGPGVTDFVVGDRVASVGFRGSYAEYSVVPAAQAIGVPDAVTIEQAAGAILQGMTAHYLCHDSYPLARGDVCLIHAGAGGVGRLLIQMAKRLGATVIATASTDAKVELAVSAGADHVINYTQERFGEAVERVVGPRMLAAVFDGVGAATFDEGLTLLRPRGVMVLFGQSSGVVPPFDPGKLASLGSLYLTRPTLTNYVNTRADLERRAGDVFSWVADGSLDVRIPHRWPLREAAIAHTELEARRTTGKVLLVP
jgi:NADPH2:quinone reductase